MHANIACVIDLAVGCRDQVAHGARTGVIREIGRYLNLSDHKRLVEFDRRIITLADAFTNIVERFLKFIGIPMQINGNLRVHHPDPRHMIEV